jgi:hypothetical protein
VAGADTFVKIVDREITEYRNAWAAAGAAPPKAPTWQLTSNLGARPKRSEKQAVVPRDAVNLSGFRGIREFAAAYARQPDRVPKFFRSHSQA